MSQGEVTQDFFRVKERLRVGREDRAVAPIEVQLRDNDKYWLKISGAPTRNEQPPKSRILLQGTTRCYDTLEVSGKLKVFNGSINLVGSMQIKANSSIPDEETSPGTILLSNILIESSQELKQDIEKLSKEEANDLVTNLEPVKFAFKSDPDKTKKIGFIAEKVPDIVSSKGHKQVKIVDILSAMTKVVQEQQKTIDTMTKEISDLKKKIK